MIAITGAGGSIGSEICRQLLNYKPKTLILIDNSEALLFKIDDELNSILKNYKNKYKLKLIPIIGSISNRKRMDNVFQNMKPNIIYHAAAYKRVTLVENNAIEGIRNNVFGTINLADVAREKQC